ncbi:DUF4259 domain-containing protein [Micromonospora sp. NPDC023633]|uniref:DUF4259 domain-containing protein n=1 Tax=Micromonospora sp. NPDC023633 TaxID=3154320 RepID=UPI0034088D32
MGTWDDGPFDNDSAADWCGDLHDADPAARKAMVRAALTTAALNTGYLGHDDAVSAIAAAAIVASQIPGGDPITSPYAPDFLLAGDCLDLDDDLPQLALDALDRVFSGDSEWRDQWGEAGFSNFPQINKLRTVLSGPSELPGQIALL